MCVYVILDSTVLDEVTQTQKDKNRIFFSHLWVLAFCVVFVNVCKCGQSIKKYKRVNTGTEKGEKGGRKKKDTWKEEQSLGCLQESGGDKGVKNTLKHALSEITMIFNILLDN